MVTRLSTSHHVSLAFPKVYKANTPLFPIVGSICTITYDCAVYLVDVLSAKKSLAICINAIYGYVMSSAISRKRIFGHNFWTKVHRMMILVSMNYVLRVKESDVAIRFDDWSVFLSH